MKKRAIPVYDGTKSPGFALMKQIKDKLSDAGLLRTSNLAGDQISGLVPNNKIGNFGFAVWDKPTTFEFNVVISGKGAGVHYRENYSEGTHEPIDMYILYPKIQRVFESLGFKVLEISWTSFQGMWDDDITYRITTNKI